jgi:metal-responsive CopG/Arc/MetJ family transcriptional regulator
MKKVGRPRKINAESKKNISVNLPIYILEKVEQKLSYGSSRSMWIQSAIENRLSEINEAKPQYYKDIDTIPLLCLIRDKPDLDDNVRFVIKMYLDNYFESQ